MKTIPTWSNEKRRDSFRASTGLVNTMAQIVGRLDGVAEIRVLHRDSTSSKFFVVLTEASLDTIERVVDVMVQIESSFRGERFDYDTVPQERLALIPPDATPLPHAA